MKWDWSEGLWRASTVFWSIAGSLFVAFLFVAKIYPQSILRAGLSDTVLCLSASKTNPLRFRYCTGSLSETFTVGPLRTYIRNQQAFAADALGKHRFALILADALIADGKAKTFIHAVRGKALHDAGRFEEAAQAYRNGLQIAPRGEPYILLLVDELVFLKKSQEARALSIDFLERRPNSTVALRAKAWAEIDLSMTKEAATTLDLASQLEPQNAQNHFLLAQVFAKSARKREAVREFEAALVLQANYLPYYTGYSNYLLSIGEPALALRVIEKSFPLGRNGSNLIILARSLEAERKYGAALGVVDEILKDYPDWRDAKILRAKLLREGAA